MTFDPFAVFALPRSFEIDRAALQRAWLAEASRWHPDRFADPVQRREAEGRSAEINRARVVLEDDEQRADALLALLGGPGRGEDKSLPEGFLMEVMEVREELQDAMASGDASRRAEVERWADEQRAAHRRRVADLFARAGGREDGATRAEIRRELNAWRYVERLIEQLDPDYKAP